MIALADELVSSKIKRFFHKDKTFFFHVFFPLRDPTSAASATRTATHVSPPCEDGVDPFATTASAANDETTAVRLLMSTTANDEDG